MKTKTTNESLETQIDDATNDRHRIEKLSHDENISLGEQLDDAADRAVVRKADFEDFKKQNSNDHKEIMRKFDTFTPLLELSDSDTVKYLKDGVKLKQSTDSVVNSWKGKAKTAAIFLGVIAVFLTILNALRDLALDWFIKLK